MKQIILTHFTITIIVVKMYLSGQLHAPALKQTFLSLSFLSLFYWIIYWKEITTERLSASSVGGQRSDRTEVQTLCIPGIISRENPVMVPACCLQSTLKFCHCCVMVRSVWQIWRLGCLFTQKLVWAEIRNEINLIRQEKQNNFYLTNLYGRVIKKSTDLF